MRRGLWLLTVAAIALAGAVAVLIGGAATGQASARTIEGFTLTGGPDPATYAKNVSFTIHFRNASTQPLVHVTFSAKATSVDGAGASAGTIALSTSSPSQGSCSSDGAAQPVITCDYGKVLGGAVVDTTFVLVVPSQASAAVSLKFDADINDGYGLSYNESGGDPGQPSRKSPTPASLSVGLQTQNGDHSSDVLFGDSKNVATNGLNSLPGPTYNRQSESLAVTQTPGFLIASIAEVGKVAGVCDTADTGVTPFLDTADLSLQGDGGVLKITMSWLKSEAPKNLNKNNVWMCHQTPTGVDILQNGCPTNGDPIPPQGCVDWVFGRTSITGNVQSHSNGKWSGGLG
jgi:hypothetical protein